jgi:hypothetical protein
MARTKAKLPGGARLADYLTLGYLAMNCPIDRVRAALAANSAGSQRLRDLPHEVLVYFVMAMNLYATAAYEEVLRSVVEGLRQLWGDAVLATGATGQAAEDLSYVHAVRVIKRRLPAAAAIPP